VGDFSDQHIEALHRGEIVKLRPHGNSMTPKIKSGQLCTIAPVRAEDVRVGDAVLVKVHGNRYLHLVKALQGGRACIGNNHGRINGWTPLDHIYGKLVKVEP
jgi:phage repressor protein C with HTH and peptisase S24 domain